MSNIPLSQYIRRGYRTKIPGRIPIQQVTETIPVPVKVVEKPEPQMMAQPQMIAASEPEPAPPKFPSLNFIVETVADFYGISVAQIVSAGRTANLVRPRHIAAYLGRTLTPRSLPVIGRALGDRDHTSILHAFNKISVLLARGDDKLRDEIEQIKTRLTGAGEGLVESRESLPD